MHVVYRATVKISYILIMLDKEVLGLIGVAQSSWKTISRFLASEKSEILCE
jgi:hypothetical protein